MFRNLFAAVSVAVLVAACGESGYANIDNTEVETLQAQGVPVIDIRLPEEWRQTGVIQGATLATYFDAAGVPRPDFLPALAGSVGKDDPVILVCRSGNRSGKLARTLVEQGYTRVYNVKHGMIGWQAEKRPTVAPSGV